MTENHEIFFCRLCNSFHQGLMAFASHTAQTHKMSAGKYWDDYGYFTMEDYEKLCRNPHEKVYRGCSTSCFLYKNCQARRIVIKDGKIISFVETL